MQDKKIILIHKFKKYTSQKRAPFKALFYLIQLHFHIRFRYIGEGYFAPFFS